VLGAVIVGLLAGQRLEVGAATGALVVGVATLGAAWFAQPPVRGVLAAIACALLGCAVMGRALDGQSRSPLRIPIERRDATTFRGVATSDPSGPSYEADLLVRVETGHGTHRTLLARATGDDVAALRVIEAGDRVVAEGASRAARSRRVRRSGSLAPRSRPPRQGAGGRARAPARSPRAREPRPSRDPARHAVSCADQPGPGRGIPPRRHTRNPAADDQRLSRFGLSHLLAVSGENVAFVMALAAPLLRRLRLGSRTALALAIVLVFAAMTRFEPSVLRASAMAAIALLATLGGRPASSLRVLAYAVVALLLADPFLLHSVAFALSCGASAGIALLSRPIGARLPGPRFLREPFAVSIGAQIGVLPVLLWVFGTFPLITPFSNLVAAPAAELLGVYGFLASAIAGVVPSLGPLLQQPTALLVTWITGVARSGAAVPFRIDARGAVGLASLLAAGASLACLRADRAVSDTASR